MTPFWALALLLAPAVALAGGARDAPDAARCDAEGALACVALEPDEGLVRVTMLSERAARFIVHDDHGRPLASGPLPADGFIALPPGAARLLVVP